MEIMNMWRATMFRGTKRFARCRLTGRPKKEGDLERRVNFGIVAAVGQGTR